MEQTPAGSKGPVTRARRRTLRFLVRSSNYEKNPGPQGTAIFPARVARLLLDTRASLENARSPESDVIENMDQSTTKSRSSTTRKVVRVLLRFLRARGQATPKPLQGYELVTKDQPGGSRKDSLEG